MAWSACDDQWIDIRYYRAYGGFLKPFLPGHMSLVVAPLLPGYGRWMDDPSPWVADKWWFRDWVAWWAGPVADLAVQTIGYPYHDRGIQGFRASRRLTGDGVGMGDAVGFIPQTAGREE